MLEWKILALNNEINAEVENVRVEKAPPLPAFLIVTIFPFSIAPMIVI